MWQNSSNSWPEILWTWNSQRKYILSRNIKNQVLNNIFYLVKLNIWCSILKSLFCVVCPYLARYLKFEIINSIIQAGSEHNFDCHFILIRYLVAEKMQDVNLRNIVTMITKIKVQHVNLNLSYNMYQETWDIKK